MTAPKGWLVGSAALAFVLYVLLWVGFAQQWRWLGALDGIAPDALRSYGAAHPGWVAFWQVFCTIFGPTAFRVFALVVIVVALVRRNLRSALFLVVTVELSGLVTEAAKAAARRPRPAWALASAPSTSFPSGHALGVMVGVLALSTVVLPVVCRRLRGWLIIIGAVVVVAIGLGRVVLGVHYVSDVVAGWALGYVWFVVGALLVRPVVPITEEDETPAAPGNSR